MQKCAVQINQGRVYLPEPQCQAGEVLAYRQLRADLHAVTVYSVNEEVECFLAD